MINEVMAANRRAVEHDGAYPDWVELHNPLIASVDLSGYRLSDDPAVPDKYVFPAGTTIPPLGYLVVWCDSATSSSGLHTGFTLPADGTTLTLRRPAGTISVADEVAFGLQLDDFSIGRDSNSTWGLAQPSPGKRNTVQPVGDIRKLAINEWMASPTAGEDWFELFNGDSLPVSLGGMGLTDDASTPGLSLIPDLSFIGPLEFQLFWADRNPALGARHANFKLAAGGEYIGLFSSTVVLINSATFGLQLSGVSEGRLPDGGATQARFPDTSTPGTSNFLPLTRIVINELLAHTDPPLEDAVELYNPTDLPVDISGWYLSNSLSDPKKYQFPVGSIIRARSFRVVYEAQFNPLPDLLPGFTFNSAHGDEVVLSAAADGQLTGYRATEVFGASANGASFGRVETSGGHDFVAQSERTFGNDWPTSLAEFREGTGEPNSGPLVGPVVISEIMYHPTDTGLVDNTDDEYLELYNASSEPVMLYDPAYPANRWQLAGGVIFTFPNSTKLAAGEFVLIVGFDPVNDAARRAAFLTQYDLPANARLLGPWEGKLDNAGEPIELYRPDWPQLPPHPDAGYVPQVLVERIVYADVAPWPIEADGAGASLQRPNPTAYGNEPLSWIATIPSPLAPAGGLKIKSVALVGNVLTLTFNAIPGAAYDVEYRPLVATGAWALLKTVPLVTSPQPVTVSDPLAPGTPARFYRVVQR